MQLDPAGREEIQRDHNSATNRRSLLAVIVAGIGTLFALPVRAHPGNTGFDAQTRTFCDLKKLGAGCQIDNIRHLSGFYRVVTADGHSAEFTETDLQFKVDSSPLGPRRGNPVLLPAGHLGDRSWVFFAAPDEIGAFIKA